MNRSVLLALWLCGGFFLPPVALTCSSAETPPVLAPVPKSDDTNAQELLRTYLQLQGQLHDARMAIEQTREEARSNAAKAAAQLSDQLKSIETALASQRARELEAMQSSNRVMLLMAGIFAALGFAAMVLMAYFQWRTVHGLAEISAVLPDARALGAGRRVPLLGSGEMENISSVAAESRARLFGALEQLEQRIHGLEQSSRPALTATVENHQDRSNGGGNSQFTIEATAHSETPEVRQLLAQGQELLDHDKPAAALAEFEKALAADNGHPEALVKKGTALERLGQFEQAVACYDQAIARDNSFTIAYLHKGGLYNRMERFGEALDCYEKALRTQEKRGI